MKDKFKNLIKTDKKNFIKFTIFFIIIVAIVAISIHLIPWMISLKDEVGREAFKDYISSKGTMGVLILLGVQIAQVIVAFIPGEPIEVVAGLLYGTFNGYVICTVGMIIGTIIIFYCVRLLGVGFIKSLIGDGKLLKYEFLNNTKKLEVITFVLFFIPGTPKDLLTYFMPLTKINPLVFFVLVTVARIPSIISSTFAGASIGRGQWVHSIIAFALIGLVAVLGIIFNEKIVAKLNETREKIKDRRKKK